MDLPTSLAHFHRLIGCPGVAIWRALVVGAALALAACGGGGSGAPGPDQVGVPAGSIDEKEAARFLHQATFGATMADIADVRRLGPEGWLEHQFTRHARLHRHTLDRVAGRLAMEGKGSLSSTHVLGSFWEQAVTAEDALRQRVAFALSQFFVISMADDAVRQHPRGVASFLDMLGQHAFGNFRELLEDVSLHPMMGLYLSHLRNRREDPDSGRVPDENYAREVMQLFTIGLVHLEDDGSPRIGADGRPVETYDHRDVAGLAKVFTGWSWAGPDRSENRFNGRNGARDPDRDWRPMQGYAAHHSVSPKEFLGATVGAFEQADPPASLRVALDTLFWHPNVGPFFCRQMIQRLVTSNPAPEQVRRCAQAFNGGQGGPRGDMKAVWRAILLDPLARSPVAAGPLAGRLREPVLRLANWMRAFEVRSQTGEFQGIGNTSSPETSLGQAPMMAPSVFNFYRPGYAPAGTEMARAGLVAPELQLVHEVSVAGYLNHMRTQRITLSTRRDVQQSYAAELALAHEAQALVDRVDLLLAAGQLSDATRQRVVEAVQSRVIPDPRRNAAGDITNQSRIDEARRDRVYIAVLLTMAAPDYLVLR